MKILSTRNYRIVAIFIVVMFSSAIFASTALSRGRHSQRHPHRFPHGRVLVEGPGVSAIIATGIIAGITFSLLDSAANAPQPRCTSALQPVYTTGSAASYNTSAGSVIVTAQMLNVRSGPGLGNPAIRQVPNGTVLSIQGNAPGWYYVKTVDNLYGWVMTQYTAPLGYSAAG